MKKLLLSLSIFLIVSSSVSATVYLDRAQRTKQAVSATNTAIEKHLDAAAVSDASALRHRKAARAIKAVLEI